MTTHYETLGIDKTATADEIKKAYKKLASKWHPDKPSGDTAKFQEIQKAYEILSDPDKRAEYDNPTPQFNFNAGFNRGGGWQGGGIDIEAMMRELHRNGGFRPQPRKNKDIRVHINTTLADTLEEQKKTISVQATNGNRFNVDITIPRGATHGTTLKYAGQGDDFDSNLTRGDLYVIVLVIADNKFELHGPNNVLTKLEINSIEAMLGTEKEVQGIDGKTFLIKIPPGCQFGTKFGLGGQGLYQLNSTTRGNLVVVVTIKTPILTEEQMAVLRTINPV